MRIKTLVIPGTALVAALSVGIMFLL